MLPAKILLTIFSFAFILINVNLVKASYNAGTGKCVDDGIETITYASVCSQNGASGNNNPAQCIRAGSAIWTFDYTVCRVRSAENPQFPDKCEFNYAYETATCSSVDRCYGSSVGGTGDDASGRVIPGLCVESAFDGINPQSACPSGGWYKTCCSSGGDYPTTACSNGSCPSGQITTAGTISCNTSAPPPPLGPTCDADWTVNCCDGSDII